MAQQHSTHGSSCTPAAIRFVIFLVGVCLVGYVMGPPLYWNLAERFGGGHDDASCPPCICDCSSETSVGVVSMPLGLGDSEFEDCGGHNLDTNKEMEKTVADLLTEELRLRIQVTEDTEQHAEASILEMKKISLQYHKEADKCNKGIETCEEAREKAEEALKAELKLSALWENRAREMGWLDRRTASS